jgi:hypothetical protein
VDMIRFKALQSALYSVKVLETISDKYLEWNNKKLQSDTLAGALQEMIDDIDKLIETDVISWSAEIVNKDNIKEIKT